jgi:hypothetical protein
MIYVINICAISYEAYNQITSSFIQKIYKQLSFMLT